MAASEPREGVTREAVNDEIQAIKRSVDMPHEDVMERLSGIQTLILIEILEHLRAGVGVRNVEGGFLTVWDESE